MNSKISALLDRAYQMENDRSAACRAPQAGDYLMMFNIVHLLRVELENAQAAPADEPKTAVNFGPGKDGQYTVRWEIDVTATSAHEAAQHARNIMKNPGSGNVLDVWPKGETGYCTRINLSNTGRMPDVPACVIVGDLANGFTAHGLYANHDAAIEAAEHDWPNDNGLALKLGPWDDMDASEPAEATHVVLAGKPGEGLQAYGPYCKFDADIAHGGMVSAGMHAMVLELLPLPVHMDA